MPPSTAQQIEPRVSVEDYLARERSAEFRHEFLDGEVYEMAGGSPNHSAIIANLTMEIGFRLKGTRCRPFSSDLKVRCGSYIKEDSNFKGFFAYPDLTVVCDESLFHDEFQDVLLNPTALFEVLSPATESFDRTTKFRRYITHLDSLTEYILISQDEPRIELYRRQPDGWLYQVIEGLDEKLELHSINCVIPLRDLYDRIVFE